ncbi:MAG: hypothetical protein AB2L13_17450 [Spirochaetota bacterium]
MKAGELKKTAAVLEDAYARLGLKRPFRKARYAASDIVSFELESVAEKSLGKRARVTVEIKDFVGGGFAGQVYRVKALEVKPASIGGVRAGGVYSMKVFIPPSRMALLFRNLLYAVGFQSHFQIQSNLAAARAGALWQKLIRRGAQLRFGGVHGVNDVHGVFVDRTFGACGELSDWVEGRVWRLEVNDHTDALKRWRKGEAVDPGLAGSPEYRSKRDFMRRFVELLHEMGAHEFARQYEWSTAKSQPNCLKLSKTDRTPEKGLVAIDFRAGLTLLPFLPMSPGDFGLILKGIARGSMVQFDRGDMAKLEAFVALHRAHFRELAAHLSHLKTAERVYRDSMPDITHNGWRLLYDSTLWSTIRRSVIESWETRGFIDPGFARALRHGLPLVFVFRLLGLVPVLGPLVRGFIGHRERRAHYLACMGSPRYLLDTLAGHRLEAVSSWLHEGRVLPARARSIAASPPRYAAHWPLSFLPVGLHRFLSQGDYFRERLNFLFVRPFRLYFDAALREEWLRDMVLDGRKRQIITREDEAEILSQIGEPFIQKYLKSLAVHVLTLPVTQMVSFSLAAYFLITHPEMPRAQAWAVALGIIALFQLIPISPGSLTRGLYVLYLVIRERNLKDYSIALSIGFFKYIGYLSFPIQMAYRYPTLARFMAAYWATDAVHAVPVFGEKGALLEHWVFSLFYNLPLTKRRRIRERAERRSLMPRRAWHVFATVLGAVAVSAFADFAFIHFHSRVMGLRDLAPLVVLLPLLGGVVVAAGAGGASSRRRVVWAVFAGLAAAALGSLVATALGYTLVDGFAWSLPVYRHVWCLFLFPLLSAVGAAGREVVSA